MPEFSFNLIFVPKLTQRIMHQLIFDNSNCLIHNSYFKKMIGTTELRGRLYNLTHPLVTFLNTPPSFIDPSTKSFPLGQKNCINSINKFDSIYENDYNIWHLRLVILHMTNRLK